VRIQDYQYTIPAGGTAKIPGKGRFVRGLSGAVPYQIRLSTENGASTVTGFQTGLAFESPEIFDQVEIINTSDTEQVIGVYVSIGKVWDSRLTGQFDLSGGIKLGGNPIVIHGAGTVLGAPTKVANANANRASFLIRNTGVFAMSIGFDATTCTAALGLPLQPGEMASITWNQDIFVYSAFVTYSFFEESLA
jgi:hypothetical protein